jgi:chromate transport protein ChrA
VASTVDAMAWVRYGVPAALALMGLLMLMFGSEANRYDGFFMGLGAALSVLFLNVLFRIGASGDEERAQEDAAREYFAQHGRWPDEPERS